MDAENMDGASGGGGAAESLGSPGGGGDDQSPPAREDTFFMPPDFPGAEALKTGDTLTLKVVGKDSDGRLEVEQSTDGQPGAGGSDDWKQDMRQTMGEGSEMPA